MRLATSPLRLTFEWEQGEDIAGPELAATWARLEIWVGSDCVTRVEDLATRSSRRAIYCSLYPLAEWVAYNWWHLKSHDRASAYVFGPSAASASNGRGSAAWTSHHNMRGSGDGYLWPDLLVLPEGASTRLLWRPDADSMTSRPIRYLTGGDQLVESDLVQFALGHLVESVLARLEELGLTDTPLAQEWRAIEATDEDEYAFALAAARLGADPYDMDPELIRLIEATATSLQGNVLGDFLSAVDPNRIEAGLDWVARANSRLDALIGAPHRALAHIREHTAHWRPAGRGLPWAIGWSQAQAVREALDLRPDAVFDFADTLGVEEVPSGDRGLEGIGRNLESGAGALVLGRRLSESGRRFATARALWHGAYGEPGSPFLLSGLSTGAHRVERAFAAELLAPASGIAGHVGIEGELVATEDIEEVAAHYGVSSLLVRHQIDNQLVANVL